MSIVKPDIAVVERIRKIGYEDFGLLSDLCRAHWNVEFVPYTGKDKYTSSIPIALKYFRNGRWDVFARCLQVLDSMKPRDYIQYLVANDTIYLYSNFEVINEN